MSQFLKKTIAIVKLLDLILVVVVWNLLKNQENQKAKNCLSLKNCLNQEKKLSKSGNLPKFGAKKAKSNFLIFDAKEIFNCL